MKYIPNFENYMIDKFGNVWSMRIGTYMKPKIANGYKTIALSKNGKYHYFNIHRLVLITYSENLPENYEKLQACHIDGNRLNNHISNLRFDTALNNTHDKYKHGTMFNCPEGELHHNAKLNADLVVKLRKEAINSDCKELSLKYGIPKLTIYDAVTGRSWKSVNKIIQPINLNGRQYKQNAKQIRSCL